MTDEERLESAQRYLATLEFHLQEVQDEKKALLAEVERLRVEHALAIQLAADHITEQEKQIDALREVVQEVAAFPEAQDETHTPMALLMRTRDKARTLLGVSEERNQT